jgi:hypothetical protein
MITARRRAVVLTLLAVVALLVGGRAYQVKQQYGELRLSPSSTPPSLQLAGRDYHRGAPVTGPYAGATPVATVAQDEPLWASPVDGRTQTVVVLQTPSGYVQYGLSGGP